MILAVRMAHRSLLHLSLAKRATFAHLVKLRMIVWSHIVSMGGTIPTPACWISDGGRHDPSGFQQRRIWCFAQQEQDRNHQGCGERRVRQGVRHGARDRRESETGGLGHGLDRQRAGQRDARQADRQQLGPRRAGCEFLQARSRRPRSEISVLQQAWCGTSPTRSRTMPRSSRIRPSSRWCVRLRTSRGASRRWCSASPPSAGFFMFRTMKTAQGNTVLAVRLQPEQNGEPGSHHG